MCISMDISLVLGRLIGKKRASPSEIKDISKPMNVMFKCICRFDLSVKPPSKKRSKEAMAATSVLRWLVVILSPWMMISLQSSLHGEAVWGRSSRV